MTNLHRRLELVAGALAVAALAGCGGHGNKSSSGNTSSATGAQASKVTATESEFKIQLSQQSFSPGSHTFVAVNNGKFPHSLEINGPGLPNQRIGGTIAPGQSKTLTVTLQKGSYDVFCPVPGHKQQGMDVHINVGGASGSSGGGMTTTTGGGGGNGY
jgi:uncharacterized lipoprotein